MYGLKLYWKVYAIINMNNIDYKYIFNFQLLPYLVAFTVFSTELFKHFFFNSYFAIDIYLILISILGLCFIKKINKKLIIIFTLIIFTLCVSFIVSNLYNYSIANFIRQGIGICLVYLGLGSLITRIDKVILIRAYMNISLFVALIGILQWLLSYFAIMDILIKVPGKMDSIFYEPSHYAIAIAPALLLFSRSFFLNLNMSLKIFIKTSLIIFSYLITFSLAAYLILLVVIIYFFIIKKKLILIIIPFFLISTFFINNIKLTDDKNAHLSLPYKLNELNLKIENLYNNFKNINSINEIESPKNLTIYSFFINLNTAQTTINSGRILGNGFGSHSQVILETAPMNFKNTYYFEKQIFNSNGFSLLIRVISEFGLPGVILYILFVAKGIFRNPYSQNIYDIWWILGSIHLITLAFKTTSFIDNGTPMFILVPLLMNRYLLIKKII